jgi:hypothetical protein
MSETHSRPLLSLCNEHKQILYHILEPSNLSSNNNTCQDAITFSTSRNLLLPQSPASPLIISTQSSRQVSIVSICHDNLSRRLPVLHVDVWRDHRYVLKRFYGVAIILNDGCRKFLLPEQDDVSKESVCRF